MTKTPSVALFVGAVAVFTTGGASASCADDLPPKLLEDCIVVEGSGSPFPNVSYAHMDQYKAWLAAKYPQTVPAVEVAVKTDKIADRHGFVQVGSTGQRMLFPEIVIDSPVTVGHQRAKPEVAGPL